MASFLFLPSIFLPSSLRSPALFTRKFLFHFCMLLPLQDTARLNPFGDVILYRGSG